jgi:hypothetical protein
MQTTPAIYEISSDESHLCLDVPDSSEQVGEQIQQYSPNGDDNQHWCLRANPKSSGGLGIGAVSSNGLVLDVPGGSHDPNVIIQQFTPNGGLNQQWYPLFAPNHPSYEIVSAESGLALDVPGESHDSQVKIQQYPRNGGANQRWSIKQVAGGKSLTGSVNVTISGWYSQLSESSGIEIKGTNFNPGEILSWRMMSPIFAKAGPPTWWPNIHAKVKADGTFDAQFDFDTWSHDPSDRSLVVSVPVYNEAGYVVYLTSVSAKYWVAH